MPKRDDIQKILVIGSGPIVIGQACEFDYSGTQACKALREEGYEVVLVNSNPATIMTDPEFADRTYVEPLTVDILHEIIRRERPDALLPTIGGQTALNLAIDLEDKGILRRYRVEMIGANAEVIRRAEDRQLFKDAMIKIGLDVPRSGTAHSLEEAWAIQKMIGGFPAVIRPAFTLGGSGGGIAMDAKEFVEICERGLSYSPIREVLVEESVLGWKEFEMEVMRDRKDNVCIVCSIENLDPMGVHTGDSITVAPAQTLTDREYQRLRDASLAVMRVIGVETGGSNVQFAINPADGRLVVIEMNPRVSRSSALASKATGFPIAKIAAKLAVGYTLDEIQNDITRETPACFEPTIDYVVTKIPRFAFEKFPGSDSTLTTQMKSVGETMAIGKTFKQSFQKALRSLEIGRAGFGADGKDAAISGQLDAAALEKELRRPNPLRIFHVHEAFKRGWSVERIQGITGIDPWFLRHLQELAAFEDEIRAAGSLANLAGDAALFRQAKEFGYSDRQLAWLTGAAEAQVREAREKGNLLPTYSLVDTCAAEFAAFTPYYYSTYGGLDEVRASSGKKKIMILGGGPNRIGQGIEFDFCCVHAAFALRQAGFETLMVNSNPETVSTDYDTSDRLYFEPVTLEDVLHIYRREQCAGVIVQFGGQTPLNLATALEANGVKIIGTSPASIEKAEDREFFKQLVTKIGILQPENGTATSYEGALQVAREIGFPVLVRPSFVLGGRAMAIVYDEESLRRFVQEALQAAEDRPVLIDRFLENAIEVDVDCIADGEAAVIGAIMEHVEKAGIHSGDSACFIPPITLEEPILQKIRDYTYALARELNVVGLMNVQYAVQDGKVYILEVNPRASRTVPFVSKATGVPLAKLAALVMAGKSLKELGFTKEVGIKYFAVKEAVLPFNRFPGCDILLSPEMRSTGEVMGIDTDRGMAYVKSQLAAGNPLPQGGNVFLSVSGDKADLVPLVRDLVELGYSIYATLGTATVLREAGVKAQALFRIAEGRPNVQDLMRDQEVGWIVNVPSGAAPHLDEIKMRAEAIRRGIPITTTLRGLQAAVEGLKELRLLKVCEVCSLQELHRHSKFSPAKAKRAKKG
ncbi:MAG: carbamoyl-phosphate synthase large subunit [Lentisphaeria bacterium]|jgi:carbamoyl-phosphate synthase large subunit